MEVVILGIVVIVLALYFGVFGMLEIGARMGNRAVSQYEIDQVKRIKADTLKEIEGLNVADKKKRLEDNAAYAVEMAYLRDLVKEV